MRLLLALLCCSIGCGRSRGEATSAPDSGGGERGSGGATEDATEDPTGGAGDAAAGTGGAATGLAGAAASNGGTAQGTGGTAAGAGGVGGSGTGGVGGSGTGGVGAGTGGTPVGAWLDLDTSRMDFGFVSPGTTHVATFTLTNRGSATSGLPITTVALQRNPGGSGAPVTVTGCNAALPAGASCVLTISVTPPTIGLFEAFVNITADPGTRRNGSSALPIYVAGWAVGFGVASPARIDLGDLAPGVEAKRSITITATSALSDLKVWTAGGEISLDPSATTCTATLAPGASCVVAVTFIASSLGWKRAIIGAKAGGDLGQVVNIEVIANATRAADLAVAPKASQTFACVFGQTSPPQIFTIRNLSDTASGALATTIVSADSVSDAARDFVVSQTDCTTLAANATCTVSVVCNPAMSASAATRRAILSIGDGRTHLAVPLTGEVSFGF